MTIIPYYLFLPGSKIALPDRQVAADLESLLGAIESELASAAISLGTYIDSKALVPPNDSSKATWRRNADERSAYEEQVRQELGLDQWDRSRDDEIRLEAERRRLMDAFTKGRVPDGCHFHMTAVPAKGFIVACHTIRSAMVQCSRVKETQVQANANIAVASIDVAVPNVTAVRDSMSHIDERVRGLAKGKPIKPDRNIFATAFQRKNSLGYTNADGKYAEVPITQAAFNGCVQAVQTFLNSLPWTGYSRVFPYLA
jgi:hypothetical protein